MKKVSLLLSLVLVGWYAFFRNTDTKLGPGVFAPDPPAQEKTVSSVTFTFKGYTVTPLASFYLKAKVLSKKTYSVGREAELSPVDLALGWGRMSDESVLEQLKIRQAYRWYRWRTDRFPIPRREIETHSGNMHLIPADDWIASIIDDVRRGDIVELSGKLVRVDADDGWRWISSLSREDVGNRSCELIWVEDFFIHEF
jgi:hypothetical protein